MASRPLWILLALFLAAPAAAQGVVRGDLGAVRDTLILDDPDLPLALKPGIVPGSVRLALDGVPLDSTAYRLDLRTGNLALDLGYTPNPGARLVAVYRTLPFTLDPVYARRRIVVEEDSVLSGPMRVVESERATADPLFAENRLRRRGSISRGLTAGSNRDVSVESGLRMELQGEITEGVRVQAVLTDENTPIQPEGTTQRLSELDRVYIQLDTDRGQARLGDVDLAFSGTEFATFRRRLQGAALSAEVPGAFGGTFAGGEVTVAGAVTRGLFQSQDLVAIEGVQGPYRLSGREGEAFIIVIAGSERVYLDGRQLTRGEANDYVIDYATGEVTFTPRTLITTERRLTVDFEYTTSEFSRTLVGAEAKMRFGQAGRGLRAQPRAALSVTVLREADGAAFGDELGLTEADLDSIAIAGDADLFISGATPVPFEEDENFALYAQQDTTFNGQTIPIFVPARPGDSPVFRVRFTRVAPGAGDYRRSNQGISGILFEWVGSGGDYVPLRRLPKPESQRLVDLTGRVTVVPGVEVFGEWAGSARDLNTLSSVDDGDNDGQAYIAGLRLDSLEIGFGAVSGSVQRRLRQARFETFDRVRSVEFNRTWNLGRTGSSVAGLDSLREVTTEAALRWSLGEGYVQSEVGWLDLGGGTASTSTFGSQRQAVEVGWGRTSGLRLRYRFDRAASEDEGLLASTGLASNSITNPTRYNAERCSAPPVLAALELSPSSARGTASTAVQACRSGGSEAQSHAQLTANAMSEQGVFQRQSAEAALPFLQNRLTPSVAVEQERRSQEVARFGQVAADSLRAESFAFLAVRPALAWTTPRLSASASVEFRQEEEAIAGAFAESATGRTLALEGSYRPSGVFQTEARVSARRRSFTDVFREAGRADTDALAIRWTTRATPLRRAIAISSTYEALTERTAIAQETYVLVGPELGEFVWDDDNGDGVPQVDEFRPELTPLEGTYVLTFVPGDDLVPTIGVRAQARLGLEPERLIPRDAPRWLRALRSVSTQTTIDVQERSTSRDLAGVYLLDPGNLQNENTLQGRFRLVQDVTLFPGEPRYGLRFTGTALTRTSQLAAGRERGRLRSLRADGRLRLLDPLELRLDLSTERDASTSDAFASRSYDIRSQTAEPTLAWTPTPAVTLSGGFAYGRKENRTAIEGQATGATVLRLPVDARFAIARRLQLTARVERSNVAVEGGSATGLAAFELTDGRGAGTSYLWGGTLQYSINAFLRASATYDGRAPAEAPTLHTVRMQVTAVF